MRIPIRRRSRQLCAAAALLTLLAASSCSTMVRGSAQAEPPVTRAVSDAIAPTTIYASPSTASSVTPLKDVAMFVCQGSGWAELFQLTRNGDAFTGTITDATVDGQPPDARVQTDVVPVTGSASDGSVTLVINGQPPIFGTVTPDSLSVQIVQRDGSLAETHCPAANPDGWNAAVSELNAAIGAGNSQAVAANDEQRREQTIAQLQSDAASRADSILSAAHDMNTDTSLAEALAGVKDALASTVSQRDVVLAVKVCDDSGDLPYQASEADYESSNVDYESGNVDYAISSLAADVSSISGDIDALNADVAQLRSLGAEPSQDPSPTITAGRAAIASEAASAKTIRGEADTLVSKAHAAAAAADAHAKKLCG